MPLCLSFPHPRIPVHLFSIIESHSLPALLHPLLQVPLLLASLSFFPSSTLSSSLSLQRMSEMNYADDAQMDDEQQQQQTGGSDRPRVVITRHGAAASASSASASASGHTSTVGRHQIKTKGRGFKSQFGEEARQDRYAGKVSNKEGGWGRGGGGAQMRRVLRDSQPAQLRFVFLTSFSFFPFRSLPLCDPLLSLLLLLIIIIKAGEFESLEEEEGGADAQKCTCVGAESTRESRQGRLFPLPAVADFSLSFSSSCLFSCFLSLSLLSRLLCVSCVCGCAAVEGWIVVVSNLHEESNEDDLYELFADHGEIKQLHLNLDRRTGYVKGYALIEYGTYREAQAAIAALNGHAIHEKPIHVDFAFRPAPSSRQGGGGGGRGAQGRGQRGPRVTGRGPRDTTAR